MTEKKQNDNEFVGEAGKEVAVKKGRGVSRVKFEANQTENGIVLKGTYADNSAVEMTLPTSLIEKSAIFGIVQLFKSAASSGEDMAGTVSAVNALIERLNAGEWPAPKRPGRASGAGNKADDLAKAVAAVKGIEVEKAAEWLATKDRAFKMKLRSNAQVAAELIKMKQAEVPKEDATVDMFEGL